MGTIGHLTRTCQIIPDQHDITSKYESDPELNFEGGVNKMADVLEGQADDEIWKRNEKIWTTENGLKMNWKN